MSLVSFDSRRAGESSLVEAPVRFENGLGGDLSAILRHLP
jgi:hypothetical protein